jgi:hypothetical protein
VNKNILLRKLLEKYCSRRSNLEASLTPKVIYLHDFPLVYHNFMESRDTPSFPLEDFSVSSQLAGLKKFFEVYLSKMFNNNY